MQLGSLRPAAAGLKCTEYTYALKKDFSCISCLFLNWIKIAKLDQNCKIGSNFLKWITILKMSTILWGQGIISKTSWICVLSENRLTESKEAVMDSLLLNSQESSSCSSCCFSFFITSLLAAQKFQLSEKEENLSKISSFKQALHVFATWYFGKPWVFTGNAFPHFFGLIYHLGAQAVVWIWIFELKQSKAFVLFCN